MCCLSKCVMAWVSVNGYSWCVYDSEGVACLQWVWLGLFVCVMSSVGVAWCDIALVAVAWSRHGLSGSVYGLSESRPQ